MSAPPGFFRLSAHLDEPVTIREAQEKDYPAIERLLATSSRAYSGLGGAMREALLQDIGLVAWQSNSTRERLAGCVLAFPQGPDVVWIHALGLAPDIPQGEVLHDLLQALEERLAAGGLSWVAYMDEYNLGWLRRMLEKAGFHRHTRVIGYEAPLLPPPTPGDTAILIRPAAASDMPAIARLDRAAFGPLWAYREQVLHRVLGQVALFLAAEWAGEIAGYVLCTCYQGEYAHVVRLAVDPAQQGQGVGATLLAAAFQQLRAAGAERIGLNTQEENLRSQRLYHRFGFRRTGDETGVWARELTRGPGSEIPPLTPHA